MSPLALSPSSVHLLPGEQEGLPASREAESYQYRELEGTAPPSLQQPLNYLEGSFARLAPAEESHQNPTTLQLRMAGKGDPEGRAEESRLVAGGNGGS